MAPVTTVAGTVDSSQLGLLLPHEHLVSDITSSFSTTGDPRIDAMLSVTVTPELSWLLNDYPYNCADNCKMDDFDAVTVELQHFASVGGRTVIDLTTSHEGRSPSKLRELALTSGVNIIAGSGWYLQSAESEHMRTASVETLITDLLADFKGSRPGPGVIGEIGISPLFTPAEERSLRAASECQRQLGVPLFIHLPGWMRYGHRVLDIAITEMGAAAESIVLCHMDPSGEDTEYQQSLASRGVFLEFDMIGMPYFYRGAGEGQSPHPEAAALAISGLVTRGLAEQILISHDMGIKSMLSKNGGNGLAYVPLLFADRLIRLGCASDIGTQLMERNPRRLFEG